ncbi:DUF6090 family protein [Ekhidna sp.]
MRRILTTLSQKWPEHLLEILVITIGVLGAFALNNWNQSSKDREREQAILGQLKTEFTSNLNQLDEKMGIRDRMLRSAFALLNNIDRPEIRI